MTSFPLTHPLSPVVTRRSFADRFLILLGVVLLGYAVDGRGFAYIGVPPLFIGEITLLAGLVAVASTRGWERVLDLPQILLVLAMMAWGVVRTVPYLGQYQIDALRDAMLYGYATFAIIVAALIVAEPTRLVTLLTRYRKFACIFLAAIPIVSLVYRFGSQDVPHWPWAGVPMIEEKEGDVLVHLSGVLAFWVAGLGEDVHPLWVVLLTLNVAMMGVIDRAGLLAFCAAAAICTIHKPLHGMLWKLIAAVLAAVLVLWVSNVHIAVPGGKGREISFDQFKTNFLSMTSDTGADGLDSTKEWRLEWWKSIIHYTVRGKYFWTGKGFGVNLADDDGFQVLADNSLRAPHSGHLDMLARAGVPGFVLWVVVQLSWLASVINAYVVSRRCREERWQGVFLFLLALWTAFVINASFDVFLEGPMGGIWFWTVFGVGAAATWIYRHRPEVLYAA
jgi:hypothetical protein